ncbi:MAG: class I SAM-dependent methyltransferase [Acidimicrobiales bacterium]
MNELERDLARFYDQQAPVREARAVPTERQRDRDLFAGVLMDENRSVLVDVGAGAGHDGAALRQNGFTVVAVDLSTASSKLCRAKGLFALAGSGRDLPLHDHSFDAAYSMSTLLHMPDVVFKRAMEEMVRVVRPGSPVAIGVWGGVDLETTQRDDTFEPRRQYWYRSDEALQSLLTPHGAIEQFHTWESSLDDLHYQFCILRTPS